MNNIGDSVYFRRFFELSVASSNPIQINSQEVVDVPRNVDSNFFQSNYEESHLEEIIEVESLNSYKLDELRSKYDKGHSKQYDLDD